MLLCCCSVVGARLGAMMYFDFNVDLLACSSSSSQLSHLLYSYGFVNDIDFPTGVTQNTSIRRCLMIAGHCLSSDVVGKIVTYISDRFPAFSPYTLYKREGIPPSRIRKLKSSLFSTVLRTANGTEASLMSTEIAELPNPRTTEIHRAFHSDPASAHL